MRHGIGSSHSGRKRHGNVLVLFAILLFGIFAMATLVIDLGIVRVTQRQMQTAADSAALEGLRFRDSQDRSAGGNDGPGTGDPGDDGGGGGFPGNANTPPFSGGRGPENANPPPFGDGGFPGNANPPPFRGPGSGDDDEEPGDGGGGDVEPPPPLTPEELATLERGRREAARDMVAWMYNEFDFAPAAAPTNFGASQMLEFSGGAGDPNLYASQLMTVNATAYRPSGVNALRLNIENVEEGDLYAEEPDQFEVKLRRTGETVDDDQRSAGPRIPFMFGRGTMLNDGGGSRQPIDNGIAVRATGRSQTAPAVAVGRPVTDEIDWPNGLTSLPGGLNVAVWAEDWKDSEDMSETFFTREPVRHVGQIVVEVADAGDYAGIKSGYVGIVEHFGAEPRVVGFVLVTVNNVASSPAFSKVAPAEGEYVIGVNTSASWASAWGQLDEDERSALNPFVGDLFSENRALSGAVHAPVLEGIGR